MNHLRRELAPISDSAWREIDAEATRALTTFLAARKLVDVTGPLGWEHAAVTLGSVTGLSTAPAAGVDACTRNVAPILEMRTPFTLARSELDAIDRGSHSPDLSRLIDAARTAALAEDGAVFNGFAPASIEGIASSSPHAAVPLDENYEEFPRATALAVATLQRRGRRPVRPRPRAALLHRRDRDHPEGRLSGARATPPDHRGPHRLGSGG